MYIEEKKDLIMGFRIISIGAIILLVLASLSIATISSQVITNNSLATTYVYTNQSHKTNDTMESLNAPVYPYAPSNVVLQNLQIGINTLNVKEKSYVFRHKNRVNRKRKKEKGRSSQRTRNKRQIPVTTTNPLNNEQCIVLDTLTEFGDSITKQMPSKMKDLGNNAMTYVANTRIEMLSDTHVLLTFLIDTSTCKLWKDCINFEPVVTKLFGNIDSESLKLQNNPKSIDKEKLLILNTKTIKGLLHDTVFQVLSKSINCGLITDMQEAVIKSKQGSLCNPFVNNILKYVTKYYDFGHNDAFTTYMYGTETDISYKNNIEKCKNIANFIIKYNHMADTLIEILKDAIRNRSYSLTEFNNIESITNNLEKFNKLFFTYFDCDMLKHLTKKCCELEFFLTDLVRSNTIISKLVQHLKDHNNITKIEKDFSGLIQYNTNVKDFIIQYISKIDECINIYVENDYKIKLYESGYTDPEPDLMLSPVNSSTSEIVKENEIKRPCVTSDKIDPSTKSSICRSMPNSSHITIDHNDGSNSKHSGLKSSPDNKLSDSVTPSLPCFTILSPDNIKNGSSNPNLDKDTQSYKEMSSSSASLYVGSLLLNVFLWATVMIIWFNFDFG